MSRNLSELLGISEGRAEIIYNEVYDLAGNTPYISEILGKIRDKYSDKEREFAIYQLGRIQGRSEFKYEMAIRASQERN